MEIHDHTYIKEIQKTFSDFYPFLSLNFYTGHHGKYESSSEKNWIDPNRKIGEERSSHLSALIEIQPHYHVADVEREFMDRLGLSVQVMKKEKEQWEQTTGLDNLSLKDLNILGRNSSDEFVVEDYDKSFEEEY
jgi:hypothetical protein